MASRKHILKTPPLWVNIRYTVKVDPKFKSKVAQNHEVR